MKHASPAAPELGTHDGLSYALFRPAGEPEVGVVVLHGAGSAKESHFDFGRGCRDEGMAALAYDARGHGRSSGAFGPGAIDDALAMVELMRGYAPRIAVRGSSMGGFQAIHAAARARALCAVVAICPAPEESLLRLLRSPEPARFECDVPATELWLESLDLRAAAADAVARHGAAPAPRARRRADSLHRQRGAVRGRGRAQAAARFARRAPSLASARPRAAGGVAPLHTACRGNPVTISG